jgi:hypothetical protein
MFNFRLCIQTLEQKKLAAAGTTWANSDKEYVKTTSQVKGLYAHVQDVFHMYSRDRLLEKPIR